MHNKASVQAKKNSY